MTVIRLRDLPERDTVYDVPHDHRRYGHGHFLRVEMTQVIARTLCTPGAVVADLSCGNAAIATDLLDHGASRLILGDYAPGYEWSGPIESTITEIGRNVDVFILSETLEHLDDPPAVLKQIRDKARLLVLSTPIEAWVDANTEHCWAWDRQGVETLLNEAGWTPTVFASLDSRVFSEPYLYGMWACS